MKIVGPQYPLREGWQLWPTALSTTINRQAVGSEGPNKWHFIESRRKKQTWWDLALKSNLNTVVEKQFKPQREFITPWYLHNFARHPGQHLKSNLTLCRSTNWCGTLLNKFLKKLFGYLKLFVVRGISRKSTLP